MHMKSQRQFYWLVNWQTLISAKGTCMQVRHSISKLQLKGPLTHAALGSNIEPLSLFDSTYKASQYRICPIHDRRIPVSGSLTFKTLASQGLLRRGTQTAHKIAHIPGGKNSKPLKFGSKCSQTYRQQEQNLLDEFDRSALGSLIEFKRSS